MAIPLSGRIAALDLGTRWVGIALSDRSHTLAAPHATVELHQLYQQLRLLIPRERIALILVGHPLTLKGTPSAQTILVERQFASLQEHFPTVAWQLWDERLTSAEAQVIRATPDLSPRHSEHAIAAALLLDRYLQAALKPIDK